MIRVSGWPVGGRCTANSAKAHLAQLHVGVARAVCSALNVVGDVVHHAALVVHQRRQVLSRQRHHRDLAASPGCMSWPIVLDLKASCDGQQLRDMELPEADTARTWKISWTSPICCEISWIASSRSSISTCRTEVDLLVFTVAGH